MTNAKKSKPQKVPAASKAGAPSQSSRTPVSGKQPAQKNEAETGARISRRAADRLRAGHVWVYASDVESLELPGAGAPALLPVADYRGVLLGTALYSPNSQIALRLVSRDAIGEAEWLGLLGKRLS